MNVHFYLMNKKTIFQILFKQTTKNYEFVIMKEEFFFFF